MIEPKLVNILACPECKKHVNYIEKEDILICQKCKLAYEIRDGIPIMLIEEARSLTSQQQAS